MDEYTLNGAMTVLYLAKLMEEHGRLEKFYEVVGCDDLSLDYDGQYLAELRHVRVSLRIPAQRFRRASS